jgi:hypothetical protein
MNTDIERGWHGISISYLKSLLLRRLLLRRLPNKLPPGNNQMHAFGLRSNALAGLQLDESLPAEETTWTMRSGSFELKDLLWINCKDARLRGRNGFGVANDVILLLES